MGYKGYEFLIIFFFYTWRFALKTKRPAYFFFIVIIIGGRGIIIFLSVRIFFLLKTPARLIKREGRVVCPNFGHPTLTSLFTKKTISSEK